MSRHELNSDTPESACRNILVVDDERPVRELLSLWLRDKGWACVQAESAVHALAQMESHPVDVVVSDINMSGKSGMWLLEQVLTRYPDMAVLMLTGSCETQTAIAALMRGAFGYLLKPIQREEFIFQVQQAWQRRELLLERRQYLNTLEQRVQEQTHTIRLAHEETIYRLVTAAGYRDQETGSHIRRTALFSEELALAVGWSAKEAESLRLAAPMHDVGKIAIPDAILQKSGSLTPQEYEQMKLHTIIGARMLADSASPVLQLAEKIALCHHERWDGTGYPQGVSGDAIPEAARILSIVDVYDALSHDRVYRSALDEDAVLSTMRRGLGTQFDPVLLALFFSNIEPIRAIADAYPDTIEENAQEACLMPLFESGGVSTMLPEFSCDWNRTKHSTPTVEGDPAARREKTPAFTEV